MIAYFVADQDHIREISKETLAVLEDFAHGYTVTITPGPRTTKALRNRSDAWLRATLGLNTASTDLIIENLNAHINVKIFRIS